MSDAFFCYELSVIWRKERQTTIIRSHYPDTRFLSLAPPVTDESFKFAALCIIIKFRGHYTRRPVSHAHNWLGQWEGGRGERKVFLFLFLNHIINLYFINIVIIITTTTHHHHHHHHYHYYYYCCCYSLC